MVCAAAGSCLLSLSVRAKLSPPARINRRIATPRRSNVSADAPPSAPAGLAAKVGAGRRAVLAGYSHIYLTTGFRQPEAVKLLSQRGYEAQFDLTRDGRVQSAAVRWRLRFTKALVVSAYSHSA